jgi:hypothetical protein
MVDRLQTRGLERMNEYIQLLGGRVSSITLNLTFT